MVTFWNKIPNITLVALLTRLMLGILFTLAGWWKVFTLTPQVHAQQFFIQGFKDNWIPESILWTLGTIIPIAELLAGLALLVGLFTRLTAFSVGLLLLLVSYGHGLQQPLLDIDGHTFTRFVLVLFLLMLPRGSDVFSIDYWWQTRKNKQQI